MEQELMVVVEEEVVTATVTTDGEEMKATEVERRDGVVGGGIGFLCI